MEMLESASVPEGHILPYDTDPMILETADPEQDALVIPRRDIERSNLSPLLKLLATLVSSPDAMMRRAGRLTIHIDGYGAESRNVTDYPNIRRYFSEVETVFPYLPFFLRHKQEDLVKYLALVANGRSVASNKMVLFPSPIIVRNVMIRFLEETEVLLHGLGADIGGREVAVMKEVADAMRKLVDGAAPALSLV